LMTHNYNYDLALLAILQQQEFLYIGILGPQKKWEKLQAELAEKNIVFSTEQMKKIYMPVGLDIGAETAEEIAISIIAEIKSVLTDTDAQSLKYKKEAIHNRNNLTPHHE